MCFTDEKGESIKADRFMLMCSGRAVKLDVDEVGEFDLCCFGRWGGGMQNDPVFTKTGNIILRLILVKI